MQGELCLSSSSSSGSIAQAVGYKTARPYKAPTAPHSAAGKVPVTNILFILRTILSEEHTFNINIVLMFDAELALLLQYC